MWYLVALAAVISYLLGNLNGAVIVSSSMPTMMSVPTAVAMPV